MFFLRFYTKLSWINITRFISNIKKNSNKSTLNPETFKNELRILTMAINRGKHSSIDIQYKVNQMAQVMRTADSAKHR